MKIAIIGAIMMVVVLGILFITTSTNNEYHKSINENGEQEPIVIDQNQVQPTNNKNFNL